MIEGTSQTGSNGPGDFDLTQFYQVFFEEAAENLDKMESALLELDVQAADDEQLNAIFRCAHSIKGGAATFGFRDVADLTHVMETLLDRLRRHELAPSAAMVDVLLESGDALRALLAVHQGVQESAPDASELVRTIGALCDPNASPSAKAIPAAVAKVPVIEAQPHDPPVSSDPGAASSSNGPERQYRVRVGPLSSPAQADPIAELFDEIPGLGRIEPCERSADEPENVRCFWVRSSSGAAELTDLFTFHLAREQIEIAEVSGQGPVTRPAGNGEAATALEPVSSAVVSTPAAAPLETSPATAEDDLGYGFFVDLPESSNPVSAEQKPSQAASAQAAALSRPARAPGEKAAASLESATIRVSVEKVDQLINLVGELVITQSMLAQKGKTLDPMAHQQLVSCLVDLERNTRQLQESVMAIRMIPMSGVFSRFPRMLRDLAKKLGKEVELHTEGEATELDKGMIEKITDPLTHLVRNSLDHGIELPEIRVAAGKPAAGTITLSAQHRGGAIAIEVRDDGRGLDRERILAKARERGLPASDAMSDAEVWQLIFEPGFSTAEVVTDVSGRGVGMDVVRKNILSLGGSVEIDSAKGYGTRVTVKLPLTLAIMDGMSVAVADETYILPLASVLESIRIEGEQLRSISGTNQVIEVRDQYLPVIALEDVFQIPRFERPQGEGILVIIESEGGRVALKVDQLVGQQQVVVKNLEANYGKVSGVSGATILGDGKVALILDVAQLIKRARH
jgi:two-component system, chemotaxis family, sensor kinase CheA